MQTRIICPNTVILECKFKFQYRGAALDFNLTEDFRTFLLYNYQAGSHKRGGLK